jgi:hypothetical protein
VALDVPGAFSTQAFGIDDLGRIVGAFRDASGGHAFLRDVGGAYTTIDVPGETGTAISGINDEDSRVRGHARSWA